MFKKILTTFLFVISGVSMHCKESTKTDKIIMSIINEYSKKIEKERNIERRIYGFVVTNEDNVYDGKIHAIDLGYSLDKNLQFDEATQLFFEMADGLIAAINRHPEIGGEFYHYPISYQDLKVGLAFDYENKGHLKKDDVNSIYIWEKELMYFIVDKEGAPEVKKKWMAPGVYKTESLGSTTHCIRKPLPETK
jgi:hypothetical protein